MFMAIGLGHISINNFNEILFQKAISCLERIKINSG